MSQRVQVYETDQVRVTFDPRICLHSGVCLRTLPAVFDINRKRWVDPGRATPEEVLSAVAKCPSGALRAALVTSVHNKLPTAPQSAAPAETEAKGTVTITVQANGSLLVEGPYRVVDADGNLLREGDRCTLCRCGHSGNKPFCDASHRTANWSPDGPR